MKNLVIVESPAKAKTIEGYLGKDFTVKCSYGHVRDLPEKGLGIDLKNKFRPDYEITSDKKDVIKDLRKLSEEAEVVWLATDDDREGEAISWHLKESLNLNDVKTRRIVFREITKKAILNAIENPRQIDLDLVNAQQARRVLDRLVGYELSPVLWKKIKTGLSAGRVQSVAVRIVVEREREIEAFKSKYAFVVKAIFDLGAGKKLTAELPTRFDTEAEARAFLQQCNGAKFTIENLEKKQVLRHPAPPFTTSTLQQEASRKLYFSVSKTMLVAQKLYESGKITYMRTDSVNLSEDAIQAAKNAITTDFGSKYSHPRRFKTKNESAQEAHEAIRPTSFEVQSITGEKDEQRLYELIWKRAIASQMSEAELEKTIVTIQTSTSPLKLEATGEVIKFDGFLKVYMESTDEDEEDSQSTILPPLSIGQTLDLQQMEATQRYTKQPPRYTEASLVKKLEEMGIGRPSTYAPTITTIQKRNYIVKENRDGKEREILQITLKNNKISDALKTENYGVEKAKLFPTDLAMVTNDFLVHHFPSVVDFHFTANVEKEFDHISEGKQDWVAMLEGFYDKFHKTIESSEAVSRKEVSSNRLLGNHPTDQKPLYVKLGKYGAYVQWGESEEQPKFANLKKGMLMETVSLEDALELFKLPRECGQFEGHPLIIGVGKFGPYIKHQDKYYSLEKSDDPLTISEERSIQIIQNKREADSNKVIKAWDSHPDLKVLNGRYGPYIVSGKKNVKIPKDKKAEELTLEDCLALAEATPDTPAKGRFGRKK